MLLDVDIDVDVDSGQRTADSGQRSGKQEHNWHSDAKPSSSDHGIVPINCIITTTTNSMPFSLRA